MSEGQDLGQYRVKLLADLDILGIGIYFMTDGGGPKQAFTLGCISSLRILKQHAPDDVDKFSLFLVDKTSGDCLAVPPLWNRLPEGTPFSDLEDGMREHIVESYELAHINSASTMPIYHVAENHIALIGIHRAVVQRVVRVKYWDEDDVPKKLWSSIVKYLPQIVNDRGVARYNACIPTLAVAFVLVGKPLIVVPETKACSRCGVERSAAGRHLSRCSHCKCVRYCSKECQEAHWKARHARDCKILRARVVPCEFLELLGDRTHVVRGARGMEYDEVLMKIDPDGPKFEILGVGTSASFARLREIVSDVVAGRPAPSGKYCKGLLVNCLGLKNVVFSETRKDEFEWKISIIVTAGGDGFDEFEDDPNVEITDLEKKDDE